MEQTNEFLISKFFIEIRASFGISVITVEPAGKASFVYSCTQTRLMINTIENDVLASFVCQNR